MRLRRTWPAAAIAGLAVAALLLSGTGSVAVRTYSLDAPDQLPVATLPPFQRVCEGPVAGQAPSRSVGIWGGAHSQTATVTVDAQDPSTGATVASGRVQATPAVGEHIARLDRTIPQDVPLRICLTVRSSSFSLWGSAPQHPNITMTGRGGPAEFSLVLLSDQSRSLLSWLPTAFSRASLWRPTWVGSWTFWLLTAVLLAGFGLAVVAVTTAAASDDADPRPGGDGGDGSPPAGGDVADPLEAGASR